MKLLKKTFAALDSLELVVFVVVLIVVSGTTLCTMGIEAIKSFSHSNWSSGIVYSGMLGFIVYGTVSAIRTRKLNWIITVFILAMAWLAFYMIY